MTDKRIKCPHCGRPLADGCAYSAVGIQCSCGHYTELKNGRIVPDEEEGKRRGTKRDTRM